MPAYRFSWEPFDDRTVFALARGIGHDGAAEAAREYLTSRVPRPNDDFIRKSKDAIAKVWLPQHGGVGAAVVRELFDLHVGPMGAMPTDADGCAGYVARCRNSSRVRDLLFHRLVSFGDRDREDADEGGADDDFVPRFGTLVPAKQVARQSPPYPHQEDAWRKLDDHLDDPTVNGVFKGVLVMPTGAGKTQTAVHWLLRRWIDAGGRVLWLAHREELLRQAARTFFRLGWLAPKRERLRLRVVSSRHCRFHQIDPADDIICCSVHSLARADAKEAMQLLQDPRLFVVIDEAHHAPAKSYRDAIHVLAESTSHRLLGLTATPTRTAERERPELGRLFGHRVIYQVTAADLIARELLARPVPANVRTGIDAEQKMTAEDIKHLVDFHEPSAEMLARLGRDELRNQKIVQQYASDPEKYGKTLIFTTDVEGAARLTDAFRSNGIEAEYVASWRPDAKEGDRIDAREILQRFRDPRSGLNVLINVEMLTEGVDLPMTRTVFLARPTSSEVLLRQMVGRALRGPKAGGNKEAHIVSFEDHWSSYRDYLSPLELFAEDVSDTLVDAVTPSPATAAEPQASWDQIIAIARAIRGSLGGADGDADVFEAVPHGMFVFEAVVEGESVHHVIHVYEHQRTCWDALIARLGPWGSPSQLAANVDALDAEFFGDCDVPKPSALDIAALVARAEQGLPRPEYVPLEGRSACDPRELAALALGKDLRASEIKTLLTERYTSLARVIYPTPLDFHRAFDDAMRELAHPEAAAPPKGTVLFEPPPSNPLHPGPHHDLGQLLSETLSRGSELLGRPLRHDGTVGWTGRFIKGWYGMADFREGPLRGRIRINRLLDSPDFSAETLRFLLWHEFLHVHLKALHTEEFRRLERIWPGYVACDREMDALNEKFGVQYW